MRNRYYDPKTGRFTQEDPIGLAGGLNLYGFADGGPASYRDPYGLSACPYARKSYRGGAIGELLGTRDARSRRRRNHDARNCVR
jgi:uncharacterized protein RhaS with RHS repeats